MLLDKTTGQVYDSFNVAWFAHWLRVSYQQRTSEELPLTVEEFRPLRKVVLLNCLDGFYGHLLLKLLSAQYYLDHCPDFDLVVLVPEFMRWLVPDGVAAIWTVKLSLRRGSEWNDWLAAEIHRRLDQLEEVWISVAYGQPHARFFDIQRFTRVEPFDLSTWQDRPSHPVVTFIWRDDRLWQGGDGLGFASRVTRAIWHRLPKFAKALYQRQKITKLATSLRRRHPGLLFAVAGPGVAHGFPDWIQDLRTTKIDEAVERMWCQQYARSHVVIGVHGSNMLLPSAHAAIMLNLLPQDRISNVFQDVLVTERDSKTALFRYRSLTLSTSLAEVAKMITAYIDGYHNVRTYTDYENVSHSPERLSAQVHSFLSGTTLAS
jgi:hypothetical protein